MALPESSGLSPFGHPKGKMLADGTWQRGSNGDRVALKLPIAFGTPDAAVLYTVPAGQRLLIERCFWEVITGFTGGSSSAIGLSSSQSGNTTKGDIHGGATGDVAATLTPGAKPGTVGADLASSGVVILEAGATIRFDRITSAFTAGAGFVHVLGQVIG